MRTIRNTKLTVGGALSTVDPDGNRAVLVEARRPHPETRHWEPGFRVS